MKTSRLRHRAALVAVLTAAVSSLSVTSAMAAAGGTAQAGAPSAAAVCTFNGQPSGSDIGNVGGTNVAVNCTGLSGGYFLSYSSPLAGLPNLTTIQRTNLTLPGSKTSLTATTLNTTFPIPAGSTTSPATSPNADGKCPPDQAQVDAGMTNCSVAVTNFSGTVLDGYAVVNYPGQFAPDATTLALAPSFGPVGTKVSVSGSNWWGDALTTVSPTITVDGVAPTTPSVTIPFTTYTPGSGPSGSGGTLTGGTIIGDFTVPSTTSVAPEVKITELPNAIPANDPPYSDFTTISATATFTVTTSAGAALAALIQAVERLGPGRSLLAKVTQARAQWTAGHITAARATVVAFISELRAQAGKTIPQGVISQLLADANVTLTLLR